MRHIVAALLFLAFLGATALGLSTQIKRAQEVATFELTEGMSAFEWTEKLRIADPETAMTILTESADATGVNLIRRVIDQDDDRQRLALTYYVYRTHPTQIDDRVALTTGRFLTQEESHSPVNQEQSVPTVSSQAPPGTNVIGTPRILAEAYRLTVLPFSYVFTRLPVDGTYLIEADDASDIDTFLTVVVEKVTAENRRWDPQAPIITADHLRIDFRDVAAADTGDADIVRPLVGVLPLLVLAATCAALARDAVTTGVMRMHGCSLFRVWWTRLGRLGIGASAAALIISLGALPLVPDMDIVNAVHIIGVAIGAITGLTVLASALGMLVINRVRVSDLIKGRYA